MARKIYFGVKFKRDLKKQYLETASTAWAEVLHGLVHDIPLAEKYRDHALVNSPTACRDCHIKPDLVLLYEKPDDKSLILVRLGSHSELSLG